MARSFQVTFDASDPHLLCAWWASVLGYEVEDHAEQIRELLASGVLDASAVVDVGGRAAFADADACRDPAEIGARLLFQRVPEPKSAKNRVHLDLHVGKDGLDAEAERLVAAGATFVEARSHPGDRWIVLNDPEGNEFCLV
jgi:hypothetical protein